MPGSYRWPHLLGILEASSMPPDLRGGQFLEPSSWRKGAAAGGTARQGGDNTVPSESLFLLRAGTAQGLAPSWRLTGEVLISASS